MDVVFSDKIKNSVVKVLNLRWLVSFHVVFICAVWLRRLQI